MERPRILIVDDEQDLCQLIKTSLTKEGFSEIEMAGTIEAEWKRFQGFEFVPWSFELNIFLTSYLLLEMV
ncbi:hypothetical protein R0K20_15130 [Staphylococcus sp. SIMBA_130]